MAATLRSGATLASLVITIEDRHEYFSDRSFRFSSVNEERAN
jgi:hypothetical protein